MINSKDNSRKWPKPAVKSSVKPCGHRDPTDEKEKSI